MRGSQKKSPVIWIFLAGTALGFYAPVTLILLVCGVVLLLGLAGKL